MVVLILDDRAMCLTVFTDTWRRLLPGILTARPMTDLCWTCQSNNHLIYRGANIPEADKTERLRAQEVLYSIVKLANKSRVITNVAIILKHFILGPSRVITSSNYRCHCG